MGEAAWASKAEGGADTKYGWLSASSAQSGICSTRRGGGVHMDGHRGARGVAGADVHAVTTKTGWWWVAVGGGAALNPG